MAIHIKTKTVAAPHDSRSLMPFSFLYCAPVLLAEHTLITCMDGLMRVGWFSVPLKRVKTSYFKMLHFFCDVVFFAKIIQNRSWFGNCAATFGWLEI